MSTRSTRAIAQAQARRATADADRAARPSIGKGAPTRAGTAKAHGEALGADEVAATREALGWRARAVRDSRRGLRRVGRARRRRSSCRREWDARFDAYCAAYPDARRRVRAPHRRRAAGRLRARSRPTASQRANAKAETIATRKASQLAIEAFARALPEMLGGSADLTGSNLTTLEARAPRRASRGDSRPATTSTTACASSAWPRS